MDMELNRMKQTTLYNSSTIVSRMHSTLEKKNARQFLKHWKHCEQNCTIDLCPMQDKEWNILGDRVKAGWQLEIWLGD